MKKVAQLKKWLTSSMGLSLLLNAAFLILVILFCDMKYEVSDDFVMDAVLSGAFGSGYDAHLLFSNIIYGGFLKLFYNLIPVVSWYFVFQIIICFVSLWAVCYIILERNHWAVGILLCIVLIAFFSDDLYLLIQFTKTAAVASCAGGALFLYGYWKKEKRSLTTILLGGGLLLVGSMIRFTCIYIALVFLLLMFIRYIWESRKQEKGKALLRKFLWGALSCIVLIGCSFGLRQINIAVWNSNPDYAYYRSFNAVRADVTDVKKYDYYTVEEQTKEIGLSETDYWMIDSWNFLDRDYFTEDILEQVAKIRTDYYDEVRSFRDCLKQFCVRGYKDYTVVIGIAVLFFLLLFLQPRRVPWELVGLVLCAALLLYLFWMGRVVYRVEYAIFVCMAIGLVTSFSKTEIRKAPKIIVLCLAALLCVLKIPLYIPDTNYKTMTDEEYIQYINDVFIPSSNFDIRKYRCNVNSREPYEALKNYMEANEDGYYLLDFSTSIQHVYYNYKPWIRLPEGYWRECWYYMGGVTINYPGNIEAWEARGMDGIDPYKSIVNDGIYVVDIYTADVKLDYLKERYYQNARMELVDTIDGMQIWKYFAE